MSTVSPVGQLLVLDHVVDASSVVVQNYRLSGSFEMPPQWDDTENKCHSTTKMPLAMDGIRQNIKLEMCA